MSHDSLGRRVDIAVFVAVVVVVAVVVGVSAQSVGFTRDEGYYFKAAELYGEWFRQLLASPGAALSRSGIDAHLSYNPEHPFLMKGLFAASALVNDAVGVAAPHNAMRFPAWCVAGLAVGLVYALGRTLRLGRGPSLAAALLFISMPRVFWHMHLATFDVAVTAGHLGLITAYLRFRHRVAGAVVIGVAFGVAAATKHNVLPVPALLVLHWILTTPRSAFRTSLWLPASFPALALVGPVVYVALWPYLWPNPVGRFGAYVAFHLRHEHYPIMLFGDLLSAPPFPWSFPWVMWALTIPAPVLVIGAMGLALATWTSVAHVVDVFRARTPAERSIVPLGDVRRAPTGSTALLLFLNALYPVVLIALPSSPIFGGTKHWMNALPFVVVLGVWAVNEASARATARPALRHAAAAVVVVVAAVTGIVQTASVWPYGLSAYGAVAGFERGAANLGLQRTFWGYEIREALPEINATAPPRARVHGGDVNADSFRRAVADGLLRKDLSYHPSVVGADVAHVEPQGEFKQQQLDVWNAWKRRDPDIIIDVDGVPLSTVTSPRRR